MTAANALASSIAGLPDSTLVSVTVGVGQMTAGELRRAIVSSQPKRVLTTGEASELFGYSSSWWAKQAETITGAYQDAEGGPWRLPYRSCEAHVAQREESGQRKGRSRRGTPWRKKAATPPAPRDGTTGVPRSRFTVVEGGHATMGREADGASQPNGPGLADSRRAHGIGGDR